MNAYSSNLFDFIPKKQKIYSEMSMLKGFVQIYEDACDMGLKIRSEKTGDVSTWYIMDERRHDGDIVHWELLPDEKTLRQSPRLRGWKLIVFND
jgi:hypothetical protein